MRLLRPWLQIPQGPILGASNLNLCCHQRWFLLHLSGKEPFSLACGCGCVCCLHASSCHLPPVCLSLCRYLPGFWGHKSYEMSPHPNDLILTFHPCINPIPSKILLGGTRDSSIISGGEGHSLTHSCVYVSPCVCTHIQSENHFDWEVRILLLKAVCVSLHIFNSFLSPAVSGSRRSLQDWRNVLYLWHLKGSQKAEA